MLLAVTGSSGLFEVVDDSCHEGGEGVGSEAEHAAGVLLEAAVVFDHAVDAFDGVTSGVVGCPVGGAVGVALVVVELVDAEGDHAVGLTLVRREIQRRRPPTTRQQLLYEVLLVIATQLRSTYSKRLILAVIACQHRSNPRGITPQPMNVASPPDGQDIHFMLTRGPRDLPTDKSNEIFDGRPGRCLVVILYLAIYWMATSIVSIQFGSISLLATVPLDEEVPAM